MVYFATLVGKANVHLEYTNEVILMIEYLTEVDVPEGVRDIVEVIGIDSFKDLVKLCGGSSVYIPSENNLTKPIRNRRIKEEFRGSYKDMSVKYGICEVQVRNIVKGS